MNIMEEIFEIRSCTEIFVNDIKMIFTHKSQYCNSAIWITVSADELISSVIQ